MQVGGMLTMIINNAEAAVERSISCIMEYAAGILGIGACAIYMFLIDWRITLVIILVQILVRFLLLSYIIKLRLVCIKLNVVFYT